MIKFFRNIRQNLLMQNKTSKYFKYAIGEIILVVIGILIALSINNWNENQKIKKENYFLSKRLLDESHKNLASFDVSFKGLEKINTSTIQALSLMTEDYKTVNANLIDSLIYNILITPSNDFYTAVLNEALSTGKVSLFENDSLKQIIYNIPTSIKKIELSEKRINTDINENLVPFFYEKISLRSIDSKFSEFAKIIGNSNLNPSDNRVIIKNRKFESILDNKYYLTQELLSEYVLLQKDFVELNRLLVNNLKGH